MTKETAADDGPKSDSEEFAWLRLANGQQAVRLRGLNTFLQKGGKVVEARVIEGEDQLWTIHVRLSDRKGEWLINRFDSDQPRSYKDVALAIDTIFSDMGYRGTIIVSTERDYDAGREA